MTLSPLPRKTSLPRSLFLLSVPLLALASACNSIGPGTIGRDRLGYNQIISDTAKEQAVLNIVKLRYLDMPFFLDVASVVSGYSLEAIVNLRGDLPETNQFGGDTLSLGASSRYTDRPTITYSPVTGQQFNRSFLTPIPPHAVLFMIQGGWAADFLLPLTVESINGRSDQISAGALSREADPRYTRAVELMAQIQRAGAVGIRILEQGENDITKMLLGGHPDPALDPVRVELAELLGIQAGASEYDVVYGLTQDSGTTVAIKTRSVLQIMGDLAMGVDAPPEHLADGRAAPAFEPAHGSRAPLIVIHSGVEPPESAFVVVRYDKHYFWIDHTDFRSKRS